MTDRDMDDVEQEDDFIVNTQGHLMLLQSKKFYNSLLNH